MHQGMCRLLKNRVPLFQGPALYCLRELALGASFTCFDRLVLDSPALLHLQTRILDDLALCKLNPPCVPYFRPRDDSQIELLLLH